MVYTHTSSCLLAYRVMHTTPIRGHKLLHSLFKSSKIGYRMQFYTMFCYLMLDGVGVVFFFFLLLLFPLDVLAQPRPSSEVPMLFQIAMGGHTVIHLLRCEIHVYFLSQKGMKLFL